MRYDETGKDGCKVGRIEENRLSRIFGVHYPSKKHPEPSMHALFLLGLQQIDELHFAHQINLGKWNAV